MKIDKWNSWWGWILCLSFVWKILFRGEFWEGLVFFMNYGLYYVWYYVLGLYFEDLLVVEEYCGVDFMEIWYDVKLLYDYIMCERL